MGAQVTPLLLGDETNGEMTFHFEDKTQEVKAGDTVFIPKGTLHIFTLKTGTATVIFPPHQLITKRLQPSFPVRPATKTSCLTPSMPPADQASNVIAFSANHGLTFQTHE